MKNKHNKKNRKDKEDYNLNEFDLERPEVVMESMQVKPKFSGRLKMLKTSISLPKYIIDDLRHLGFAQK